MEYHQTTVAKASTKPTMAVLAGPTRSFMGWAYVRTSKLSRSARRFVVLRSSNLIICATENPRSQILTVGVCGASLNLTSTRYECLIRAAQNRIWIQWASETELRICKSAFEFANRSIEDYYKLLTHRQLGKGRASEVVFAFDTATGDHAAVKVMNKDKARSTDREFAEKEVLIRMTIQHPCIVQTLDIFESPYDLFVVMELMGGGSLDRRIVKSPAALSEGEARLIMRRLFAALQHLHSRNIAHRNVKPQNIFLDYSDEVRWPETAKLSDFSLACFLQDPDSSRQVVGTPEYLAPEASIMTRSTDGGREVVFGTEVDMWSSGVTLYNLLSSELPFEGEYPPDVFKKARSGRLEFSRKGFSHVSKEAISLIRALLNVDRRKRLTADTVLLHPWFEKERKIDGLIGSTRRLSLSTRMTGDGEGIARLRVAAVAVMACSRLLRRTPGLQVRESITNERRFHFNISGVNIAPIREQEKEHSVRKSATLLSRVSTGSTVKSRSSAGGDSLSSPFTRNSPSRMQRSDGQSDYFGRVGRADSTGSENVIGVHRLMSDTAGLVAQEEEARTRGRWRRRRET